MSCQIVDIVLKRQFIYDLSKIPDTLPCRRVLLLTWHCSVTQCMRAGSGINFEWFFYQPRQTALPLNLILMFIKHIRKSFISKNSGCNVSVMLWGSSFATDANCSRLRTLRPRTPLCATRMNGGCALCCLFN